MNLPHHRRIRASQLTPAQWEAWRWVGNICLMLATLTMVSPHVASAAITPWALFLMGNIIWFIDSVHQKSLPWASIAAFLGLWDILIMTSRLTGIQMFGTMDTLISWLNLLP